MRRGMIALWTFLTTVGFLILGMRQLAHTPFSLTAFAASLVGMAALALQSLGRGQVVTNVYCGLFAVLAVWSRQMGQGRIPWVTLLVALWAVSAVWKDRLDASSDDNEPREVP